MQWRQLRGIFKTFPIEIDMTLGKGRGGKVSLMSARKSKAVFINVKILH